MSQSHHPTLLFHGQVPVSFQQALNIQLNNPTTITAGAKDDNSILIQNLDKFVTESMLHVKFSEIGEIKKISLKTNKVSGTSLGSAMIEFKNESSVKEAVRKFNMKKFFENNQEEQKFMEVVPKVNKEKLDLFKKTGRLFFKMNLEDETDTINPTEVSDILSVYGDIHQIKFNSKRGKLLNYGQIIFKSNEVKEKALKGVQASTMKGKGFSFQFSEYDENQKNFNLHVTEHDLINQPISEEILSNAEQVEKERARLEERIKEDIKNKNIEFQSIYLSIDSKHKKPFFFISFKSSEMAEKTQKDFALHGAVITSLTNRKSADDQFKILHLKNLQVIQLTEEQKVRALEKFRLNNPDIQTDERVIIQDEVNSLIKQKIENDLANLKFENFSVKVYPVPENPKIQNFPSGMDFQESRQATLQFSSPKQGIQLLQSYLEKPYSETIKTWFVGGISAGKINILLSQNDLQSYKNSKLKGQQEQISKYQRSQLINLIAQQNQFPQNPQSQTIVGNNYQQFTQVNSQPPIQQQTSPQTSFQQRNQSFPQRQYNNYNNNNNNYSSNNNNNNYHQGNRQQHNGPRNNAQQNQPQQYRGQQNFQQQNYQNQNRNSSFPGGQRVQNTYNQGQNPQFNQQNRNQVTGQVSREPAKPIQAVPQQISSNQIQQQQPPSQQLSMTVDQIRENADDFLKKPDETKKTILGQLIYPKVKAKLDKRNEDSKTLTPKITGMLIDFTVFELEDIIDMIDKDEDLEERIDEALELIKTTQ